MMKGSGRFGAFRELFLYFAWLVSVVATLGSLYFSEVAGFEPCKLCWIQRIFMYPLSIILGIAAFLNDVKIRVYVLPLSITGGLISLFHYAKQKVPFFASIPTCVQGVPCEVEYINWLGFITIPFLAMTAFFLVTVLLLLVKNEGK